MPRQSTTTRQVNHGDDERRVAALPEPSHPDEDGYSTAELLGNAALAIGALGLIWVAIGDMGQEIVEWIGSQLMSG